MGKKSRAKKLKEDIHLSAQGKMVAYPTAMNRNTPGSYFTLEKVLLTIIRFGAYAALFAPFVIGRNFFFPFVGPKSLYLLACCEVVFFAWLILVMYNRQYLPKANVIFWAFLLFIFIFFMSALSGADFSGSFWSKFERMTGVLVWFHLFGFFLAISGSFKSFIDWKKVFIISVFVSLAISALSILEMKSWQGLLPLPNDFSWVQNATTGLKSLKFSDRGGFTLGNTSFLGAYLLFNAFLALYLFFNYKGLFNSKKVNLILRIFCVFAIFMAILSMYRNGARAALISTIGGFFLIFLLWLSLVPRQKWFRVVGRLCLAFSVLAVIAVFILLFAQGSYVQQKFVQMTSRARFINWGIAWRGFLERPLLGWGPENYILIFPKFFNPCLFTPECGGEIWFDRAHNIVFDTLVTTGAIGFLAYLGLFFALFYGLFKRFWKERTSASFWFFAVLSSVSIAYFIQNLTVFDMPVSLLMFALVLACGSFIAGSYRPKESSAKQKIPLALRYGPWLPATLLGVSVLTFYFFVVQPATTDTLVIKALSATNPKERLNLYKKTLEASPAGKYQIREFFAQQLQDYLQNPENQSKISLTDGKATMEYLAQELEQTKKESPYDYRSILRLANLYNFYSRVDGKKLALAEANANLGMILSPDNQQNYWTLAQVRLFQGRPEEALELAQKAQRLDVKVMNSHVVILQIARLMGDEELFKKTREEAIKIDPTWEQPFKSQGF